MDNEQKDDGKNATNYRLIITLSEQGNKHGLTRKELQKLQKKEKKINKAKRFHLHFSLTTNN